MEENLTQLFARGYKINNIYTILAYSELQKNNFEYNENTHNAYEILVNDVCSFLQKNKLLFVDCARGENHKYYAVSYSGFKFDTNDNFIQVFKTYDIAQVINQISCFFEEDEVDDSGEVYS